MSDLNKYKIDDVMELVREPVDVRPDESYSEIGVRSFGRGMFHKDSVTGADLGNKRVFWIRPDELIFNTVFAWEGAVAVSSEADAGRIGSHRFMTYQVNNKIADVRYLYYYFTSERGLATVAAVSPGSAGRNRTLGIKAFDQQVIALPNLDEQRRIVAKLDSVMRLTRPVVLESSRLASKASAVLAAQLAEVEEHKSVGDVVRRIRRVEPVELDRPYKLAGVRWYGEGVFIRERKLGREVSASSLSRLKSGDFVYNRLFGWKGAFAYVDDDFDGASCSNEFPIYRGQEDVLLTEYLALVCGGETFWKSANDKSKGMTSTSRNRLKEADFEQLVIPMPSLPAQERLIEIWRAVRRYRRSLERREQVLEALRPSLLNAAFSGQL